MKEMTPRERVLTSLSHEEPDRVPLDLGGLATTIESVPYKNLGASPQLECWNSGMLE